jgi:hypothetical protein
MKKKIATLLLTVAMAAALLAGPALARDSDDSNQGRWRGGEEWREHHPYQGYGYNQQPPWLYGQSRYQGYGYQSYGYQQPPWNYGQSRYGNNGWRSHRDYDHDGD